MRCGSASAAHEPKLAGIGVSYPPNQFPASRWAIYRACRIPAIPTETYPESRGGRLDDVG
jgi:hypothetical protein